MNLQFLMESTMCRSAIRYQLLHWGPITSLKSRDKLCEMTNPFDDDSLQHFVLRNAEGQYSLWPEFAVNPDGWSVVFGPAERRDCLEYVEQHWVDMRPLSLVREHDQVDRT